ncbi:MAG: hypothetical protein DRJ33_08535 [Candidatus Methanomethylicota archaeon]|uniref:Major facilitator superfamily (MFS) profile domain-containing protein n=1 Tax=Thermoproteota archaeon TaxID=2056631 RepID=A0A497EPJ1_9CREN|nr:MAG: hypothetical protein DRJ33_08535 [Candidatus Verstraetearchaeota archaeon]
MFVARRFAMLTIAGALGSIATAVLGPIYVIYVEEVVNGTFMDALVLSAVFGYVLAILETPMGKLSDRIGRKELVFYGGILNAAVTLSYTIVNTLHLLYVIEIVGGVATAMQKPAWKAALADITDNVTRGKYFGFYESIYDIATTTTFLLAGAIAWNFGLNALFYVCALAELAAAIIVFKELSGISEVNIQTLETLKGVRYPVEHG